MRLPNQGFRWLGQAILGFCLIVPAFGQLGAIGGKVTGEDGKPAGKDKVYLRITRNDIKGEYGVWTNNRGEYFHAGLPNTGAASYTVTAIVGAKKVKNKPEGGREVANLTGVRPGAPGSEEINFDLADAARRSAGAGPVDADPTRGMSDEEKAAFEKALKEREAALAQREELNSAFNLGMQAKEAKQWDTAVTNLAKAVELDPTQHVVWANLGESYGEQASGKSGAEKEDAFTKGMEAWQQALTLQPENANYHNNYALLLAKAGKFDLAQGELSKAAQIDPTNAGKYYYNLGASLTNVGLMDEAGQAFRKALELDPSYADAHYQLGINLLGKATTTAEGQVIPPDGTIQAFEKYIELAPTGPFANDAKSMIDMLKGGVQATITQ